jgi:acyl-CoA thioester hydrolase
MTTSRSRSGLRAQLPEHCVTQTARRVGVVDTDLMGIVHHSNYVVYFEEGRLEYMRRRGAPYKQLVERGLHMPVVELQIRYRKPAHFDDLLCVSTRLGALTRVTLRFDYSVRRVEPAAAAPEPLLEGHVLLACVDTRQRPRAIPEDFVEILLAPEATAAAAEARARVPHS